MRGQPCEGRARGRARFGEGRTARLGVFGALVVFALAAQPGFAQEAAAVASAASEEGRSQEYRIGPGDVLSVEITDVPALSQSPRVSNSGKIHLPYLGVLKVNGLTASELEAVVARALDERSLVNNAWVHVRVVQYRSQPVYVLGEVMLPGQFVIKSQMFLTDLITLGGGFNSVASRVGYLYRRKAGAENLPEDAVPTDEAIPIDFAALNEGRSPELNLELRGGDILYVPEQPQEYFFVVGDVRKPGHLPIQERPLLVSRAIAMAGGPLRTAKMSKGVLVRFDRDGKREEIPVDFSAIIRGRKPDVEVRLNDIVFIPGSTAKTLGYGLLGVIPGALTQNIDR